jgi:NAD(P)-dependent dehydrogenase (short-subunit alcohol dehydrogenase family)
VRERSADGYEVTFAVNHPGHFLPVNLLLDYLQPPARILFVSSGALDPAQVGLFWRSCSGLRVMIQCSGGMTDLPLFAKGVVEILSNQRGVLDL